MHQTNERTVTGQMSILLLEKIVFWFMIYSVGGWVYETILCSVSEKRFINRGFLNGPYCPIYGCGALLDILILGRISNAALLFLLGVIVTCTLEYLTSYLMEKLFHARWWDYSKRRFNINGRVCLIGAIVFGAFSVVLIKYLHPAVIKLTDSLSYTALTVIVIVFAVGFITDSVITLTGFSGFNKKLAEFSKILSEKAEGAVEKVQSSAVFTRLSKNYSEFISKLNSQQRRMISAFPKLKSVTHESILNEIKHRIFKKERNEKNEGSDSEQ